MATRQRYCSSNGAGWDCDGVYQFAEGPRESGSDYAAGHSFAQRKHGGDEATGSRAFSAKFGSYPTLRIFRIWFWKLQRHREMIDDLLTGFVWSANFGILAYLFLGFLKAFS